MTTPLPEGNSYSLPLSILREMEGFFRADFSSVRFGFSQRLEDAGIAALAGGSHVCFAPERFDPDSERGRFLLVHELAHVLQQRSGRVADPGAGSVALALDPRLEREADRAAEIYCSAADDCGAQAGGLPVVFLPVQGPAARGLCLQPAITVANAPYPGTSAADPRIAANGLYQFLATANDINVPFQNVEALVKFITRCSNLYTGSPHLFTDPAKRPFLEKISSFTVNAVQKAPAVWSAEINLQTEKGSTIKIPVFSSVKRHLILSYMSNQTRPRNTEALNSVVRDSSKFEEHLKRYAEFHAAKIKDNLIAFGYEPCLHADANAEMAFKTDTTMLPNISYASQLNGIHSFPDAGTEVRSLTPQQYRAVTVFLLWFFRTDENLVEGEKFNKINLLSAHETKARDEIHNARIKKAKDIDDGIKELKKYKVPKDLSATTATAEAARIEQLFKENKGALKYPNVLLRTLASNIFELLLDMGTIAAIEKAPGAATKKASETPDQIKPLTNPQIRFKTHKYEVKQHIPQLSNDLMAWMIHGHVSVEADAVLTSINSTTKSRLTVQEQIKDEQLKVKPRTERNAALKDTLADFYKYYAIGAAEKVFNETL